MANLSKKILTKYQTCQPARYEQIIVIVIGNFLRSRE